MTDKVLWPSWRYGPNGEAEIFETEDQVPAGWADHPDKARVVSEEPVRRGPGRPKKPVFDDESQF